MQTRSWVILINKLFKRILEISFPGRIRRVVSYSGDERRHVFVRRIRAYSCAHAISASENCAPMVGRIRKKATGTAASSMSLKIVGPAKA